MIADEVMAGFGRCGEWFAVDRWGVTPDLIAFAKGVNSGYIPLGGVVISRRDRRHVRDEGRTRAGSPTPAIPLACASAVASIGIFKEEGIVEHARHLGDDIVGPALADMAARAPVASARCAASACSGRSSWSATASTREPLVPYNAAGPAAAPMGEFAGGMQGAGPVAVHALQPHPRRATADDQRRRDARGPGDHRRVPRGHRPVRGLRRDSPQRAGTSTMPSATAANAASARPRAPSFR